MARDMSQAQMCRISEEFDFFAFSCIFHLFCRVMFHNSSDLFIFLPVSSVLSRSGKRIESQMCCWPFGSGTWMDEPVDEPVDEPCVNAVSQVQSPQRVLGP